MQVSIPALGGCAWKLGWQVRQCLKWLRAVHGWAAQTMLRATPMFITPMHTL